MMKRFMILLFLAFGVFSLTLMAQELENEVQVSETPVAAKPYRIGVGLGGAFTGFREETDTPINRYVNALIYIIDGNIEKGSFLHSFYLDFYMGNAQVAKKYREFHQDYDYEFFRGRIEYALDYRMWSILGDNKFPGFLGGMFRTDISYFSDNSGYMDSPKLSSLFSLGVHATQKWIINPKNTLTLSAGIPLFTYAVRPAFAGMDDYWQKYAAEGSYAKFFGLGSFASIHNYWAIFSNVKYSYQFNSLLSFFGGLGFEFSHINVPKHRPRRDVAFLLNAGISFTF